MPLRDGTSGKSRLGSVLSDTDRRALVTVLARHVVGVLLESPQVGRVVIVTADVPFTRTVLDDVPGGHDVEVLSQPANRPGLNEALEFAREHLWPPTPGTPAPGMPEPGAPTPKGPGPEPDLLVAHADLPALTSSDIAALATGPTDVVIATDRIRQGTNLLLLRAPAMTSRDRSEIGGSSAPPHAGPTTSRTAAFRFRFGAASRTAHEEEAVRLGLSSAVVSRPGTAVDLDTTDDWAELPAHVRHAVGRDVSAHSLPR